MKKLNNKGYMLIEIIIASVLAFTIGFYLIELTTNFSNKDEDIHKSLLLESDKTVITKSIMNDLEGKSITDISCSSNSASFKVDDQIKKIEINNKIIKYGLINGTTFVTTDKSYYYKKLDNSVKVGNFSCNIRGNILSISIPITSIYSNDDYGINLLLGT